jgi:hypothetical protein
VKQTPLPGGKPGAFDRITIADGEFSRESDNLAVGREQARIHALCDGERIAISAFGLAPADIVNNSTK